MNEILKTILSFLATIITALLIYLISKKLDLKLDKRLEKIEEQLRKVMHDLELDSTIDTYMSDLYKYLNYLYKKNINNKYIEIFEDISNNIITNIIEILRSDALKKERAEQVEMMITAIKDCGIIKLDDFKINIDIYSELMNIYKDEIIDIIFDAFNKKETRCIKTTIELLKNIFTYYSKTGDRNGKKEN